MEESKDISAYKPNPSVIAAFQVDETMEDRELTFDVLRKLVLARKTQDAVDLIMGRLLKLIHERKLYKHLDFETFEQFLASEEISFSREKAYMLMRVFEFYAKYLELSDDAIKEFPINRLSSMIPVLKKIDNKEDQLAELERIKSLRHGDFIREVKSITNKDGKPSVYFSNEAGKWIVNYYPNVTSLITLGDFIKVEDGEVVSE